jgi:hypothetical protein
MPLPYINSRADLDGLDEEARAAWLERLAKSLWRLERDDANQRWIAVEDTSTLERYGFTAADFPLAPQPELPEWIPLPVEPVPVARVTPRQARLALKSAGLLTAVTDWIATADEDTQIEWEFATEIRRDWPALLSCATALGLTAVQLDELFTLAGTL